MREEVYINKGAVISQCGTYRYLLWREWRLRPLPALWDMWVDDAGQPVVDGAGEQIGEPKTVLFVMLNPSTADGDEDDPTIRRCVGFAKAWGYDRMAVVNLFAYRATDPKALLALSHDDDPCGPENQRHIMREAWDADRIVCAWGAHGDHIGQSETVLGWLEQGRDEAPIECLGTTASGQPKHPLYLPASTPPVPFIPTPGETHDG